MPFVKHPYAWIIISEFWVNGDEITFNLEHTVVVYCCTIYLFLVYDFLHKLCHWFKWFYICHFVASNRKLRGMVFAFCWTPYGVIFVSGRDVSNWQSYHIVFTCHAFLWFKNILRKQIKATEINLCLLQFSSIYFSTFLKQATV